MGIKGSQGRRVCLARPNPHDFQPEDTARALAHEHRYAGNYGPYSVAQHAVLVARTVELNHGYPPQVLAALHHDDSEIVHGDLPKPVKDFLRAQTSAFSDLEHRLKVAIERRYHVDLSDPAVKWADSVVFKWEVARLVPEDARWIYVAECDDIDTAGLVLPWTWFVPWSPAEAVARYMETHDNATHRIENQPVPEDFANDAS